MGTRSGGDLGQDSAARHRSVQVAAVGTLAMGSAGARCPARASRTWLEGWGHHWWHGPCGDGTPWDGEDREEPWLGPVAGISAPK